MLYLMLYLIFPSQNDFLSLKIFIEKLYTLEDLK
jgi:hypothetical protein